MKKKLVFLVTALVMLLSVSFAACTNATPTRIYRWDAEEGQTLVYDISKINEYNSIAPSKVSSSDYDRAEYRLGIYNTLKIKDESEPFNITGVYTVNIKQDEENSLINIYTEKLEAYITYKTSDLKEDFLQKLDASFSDRIIAKTETTITVKTTVTSKTAFYPSTLKPVSSQRSVKSVYVGKSAQEVNDYTINCNYVTEKSSYYCEYTFTDNIDASNNQENRFKFTNTDAMPSYDNNLFFLAPRLYESSQVVSGVSYNIIEPLLAKSTVSFSLGGYSNNTIEVGDLVAYKASIYMTTQMGTQFSMAVDTQQKRTIDLSASRNTYIPLLIQQDWLLFTLQKEYIPAEALVEPTES